MKTILYMAMTVNGKIAGIDNDTSWTSKEDWDGFRAMCRRVGNTIIGRCTYDMVKKEGLIDEIYIDIEPLVLGHGILLFADGDFAPRLKLLGIKTLPNNQTVRLHYQVQ